MVEDVAAQEVGYLLDEALCKCQDQLFFQSPPPPTRGELKLGHSQPSLEGSCLGGLSRDTLFSWI